MQQGPVAECGNVLQQLVDRGRDRGRREARELRVARRFPGVTPQSGEAAHRFAEQALVLRHEADVPVV